MNELGETTSVLQSIKRRRNRLLWTCYEERQCLNKGHYTRICSQKKISRKTEKKTDIEGITKWTVLKINDAVRIIKEDRHR